VLYSSSRRIGKTTVSCCTLVLYSSSRRIGRSTLSCCTLVLYSSIRRIGRTTLSCCTLVLYSSIRRTGRTTLSCCTLVLYSRAVFSCCIPVLYSHAARMLFYSYCNAIVRMLYSCCTPTVLYSCCTPTVLLLYACCTYAVLVRMLYRCCTHILYACCTHAVRILYCQRTSCVASFVFTLSLAKSIPALPPPPAISPSPRHLPLPPPSPPPPAISPSTCQILHPAPSHSYTSTSPPLCSFSVLTVGRFSPGLHSQSRPNFIDAYFDARRACPPLALGKTLMHYGRSYGVERTPRSGHGPKRATSPMHRTSGRRLASAWERENTADRRGGARGSPSVGVMVGPGGFRTGPACW
jgi:hypothetical protein